MNSPIYCPSCQLETKEWIESSCSSQKICPDSDLFFSAYFPGSSDVAPFPIPLTRDLHLSQFRAVRHSYTTCQRRALHRKRMGFRQVLVGHPRTAKQLLYLVVVSFFITLFFVQPLFTFSEPIYVWNSRSFKRNSCNRQTGRINGIDFLARALIPGNGCKGMKTLNPEDLVRTLVEDGGWW